jgi:cytoskeleton protein RodZ
MNSIGETLRRERLRRNLDLDKISRELKISSRFLEAIEEERFDKLPAGVFAKSFVRQYARLLELDEEELANQVQKAIEPEPSPLKASENWQPEVPQIHVPRVEEWETVGDQDRFKWSSSLPALALVVAVMLVCSGVYSFWQRSRHPAPAPPVTHAAIPTTQPQAQQPPAAPAVTAPQPPASNNETASAPPPAAAPAPAVPSSGSDHHDASSADRAPDAVAGSTGPTGLAGPTGPAAPQPADQTAPPNPNATVRVELTADEPVWVLARADGKFLFSGTIEPNQTRVVEASGTLLLRLGNAGGVNITLNGKPIGTVGAKGQVRDVQFTSGGFHIVAAPKPSLPPAGEPI